MTKIKKDILTQLYLRGHISKELVNSLSSIDETTFRGMIESLLSVLNGQVVNGRLEIPEPLLSEKTSKERIGRVLNYYEIPYHVYKYRLQKGWDMLSAATTPKEDKKGKGISDHLGNYFISVTEMCKFHKVEINTYYKRLKRGWSVEESLQGKNK